MVKSITTYQGGLHCSIEHAPSRSVIETDAPIDNQGKGEKFSPTDLIGAALGSCILTTMAMVAERASVSIAGARASVEKEMNPSPRRIAKLSVTIELPKNIPADLREKLERAAHKCPVHQSLAPEVEKPIMIHYTLS